MIPYPSYDVVIAGGGVTGCAVAYFLTARPDFDGAVLVVERDPSFESGSTARSVGGIRRQFSTPANIRMSAFAYEFLFETPEKLAFDGEIPDLGFRENGYLFLASETGFPILKSNHSTQIDEGADVEILDKTGLAEKFPWMSVGDIAAGSLGLSKEGWIDPHALLQAFRRKAKENGVEFVHDTVVNMECNDNRIQTVSLESGVKVASGHFVNATGPEAAKTAVMAGIDLPVRPAKRLVFVIDTRRPMPGCPLVIDPGGVYFRPEGQFFITGLAPSENEEPDATDPSIDYSWFEERIWPCLAARAPMFESLKVVNAWSGLYAVNTLDHNAILGPHPDIGNFYFANGFSGHGLQQSPAVGRGIAEQICAGRYETLDLSIFGFGRIAANKPIREINVV